MNDEKLTASGFPIHSHSQQRCFQQTLRFGDVLVLADYLSNRLTRIWPPNVIVVVDVVDSVVDGYGEDFGLDF